MDFSTVQAIKSTIVSVSGLPRDALHVYAGLSIFLFSAFVWRRSLGSFGPWLSVLLLALIVELIDMGNDLMTLDRWRWGASFKDIFNTLFWPTVLLLYSRFCPSVRRR
jgi:hypothetical protein